MKFGFARIVYVKHDYYVDYYYNLFWFESWFYVFIAYVKE